MRDVVQLMEANVGEPLTLAELARLAGLSQRQLQRMFRQHLDTSPLRHYLELRLRKARELLRQTDLPLARIGADCGFRSAASCSKAYRDLYHIAPSAERRSRQA